MTTLAHRVALAAVLACVALSVGCGAKTPDYQSIWTTPNTAEPAAEDPMPVGQYLEKEGIAVEPVAPDDLKDLTVSIPTPPGWSKRDSPNLPPATTVIGKGESYPTAILTVFRLNGDVDPAEVAKHGFADAEQSQNFRRLDSSTADFKGFPSAMIQGSLDQGGQRVHSWFRMVVATGGATGASDGQHYLVQLAIITLADKAAEQADDVETIINGFVVEAK